MKNEKNKSPLGWVLSFVGRKKKLYIASVILAIFGVLCGIIPYILTGNMILALMKGNREWSFYLMQGLLTAICQLGKIAGHNLSTTCSHIATFNVLGEIRKQLCDKLSRVPLGYVKDTPSGTLKNIMAERLDSIETTLAHILPEFTSNLLAPLCVFVYMLMIDWRMAFITLIPLVLGLICYSTMMIGYTESCQNTINKTKILNDTAVEYINGIQVIKAFGKSGASYERFAVAAKEGASCFVEWMRWCNIPFSLAMILAPFTMITVLPFGGLFVMNGSLAAADFIMIILLSVGLIQPLITVMGYSDDLAKLGTIVGEITGILTREELIRPEKDKAEPVDNSVVLDNVTFGYNDKEVLCGINMEIPSGKVCALVGPSGSGKSTVAKLIASLWDVKGGSIKIGGVDIRDLSLEEYNRRIAYVAQDNYLFDDTVRENIRMGRLDATDAEVEEIAKKSGCHDFIMALDKGYDTIVGGSGGHLSGGERQRIAIARAMLKNAPIVILDEATANVDPENEKELVTAVESLTKEKTIIMIAHRLKMVRNADQILVVDKGRIVQQGKHDELMREDGIYKRFVNARETAASWKL